MELVTINIQAGSGRDVYDLMTLAKRHFGATVKVTKNSDESTTIHPSGQTSLSTMSGFIGDMRKLGEKVQYFPDKLEFVVTPAAT